MKKSIIVIPAYNPQEVLLRLAGNLQKEWVDAIVCVNDGSESKYDSIFESLQENEKVHVLKHAVNMGKGRALKTAFNFILNQYSDRDMVVTVDADGQHTIEGVEKMYSSFATSDTLILGKREFGRKEGVKIPLRSKLGNECTKLVFRFLCGIDISDTQTGLRAIPMGFLPRLLKIGGEGYEYETNCLLWCKEEEIAFKEIDIETIYENQNATSHFNPLRDSLKIYLVIFKYMCSSILSVIIDYFIFFFLARSVSNVFLLTYSGRICSSIINFMVNRKIVFKTNGGSAYFQAVKYLLLVMVSGTLSALLVSGFRHFIADNLLFAKVIVEFILFFFNFYIQKTVVFNKHKLVK